MPVVAPCKVCDNHGLDPGCHSTCPRYSEYKVKMEAVRRNRNEDNRYKYGTYYRRDKKK